MRLQLAQRVLSRLHGERLSKRDIYRSLGISAALCDELLYELESAELVRQVDNKWERAKDGMLLEADTQTLFLKS